MATLHITRGLPGSGKTTYARKWVARRPIRRVRMNRDDLRMTLFETFSGLTDAQEKAAHLAEVGAVTALLTAGWDVIVDDTNLRNHFVLEWQTVARRAGAKFRMHPFFELIDTCVERDRNRAPGERVVGEEAIRAMAKTSGFPERVGMD